MEYLPELGNFADNAAALAVAAFEIKKGRAEAALRIISCVHQHVLGSRELKSYKWLLSEVEQLKSLAEQQIKLRSEKEESYGKGALDQIPRRRRARASSETYTRGENPASSPLRPAHACALADA